MMPWRRISWQHGRRKTIWFCRHNNKRINSKPTKKWAEIVYDSEAVVATHPLTGELIITSHKIAIYWRKRGDFELGNATIIWCVAIEFNQFQCHCQLGTVTRDMKWCMYEFLRHTEKFTASRESEVDLFIRSRQWFPYNLIIKANE